MGDARRSNKETGRDKLVRIASPRHIATISADPAFAVSQIAQSRGGERDRVL